jgi:hypothetical protein
MSVWTPGSQAASRNTQSLQEFGILLWRLAKIDEPEKELY